MTKTLIKAALLLPLLATSLATGAFAGGYGHHHFGPVKSFGWHKPVVKIVPAYKSCTIWSYNKKVCLKWY